MQHCCDNIVKRRKSGTASPTHEFSHSRFFELADSFPCHPMYLGDLFQCAKVSVDSEPIQKHSPLSSIRQQRGNHGEHKGFRRTIID